MPFVTAFVFFASMGRFPWLDTLGLRCRLGGRFVSMVFIYAYTFTAEMAAGGVGGGACFVDVLVFSVDVCLGGGGT